MTLKNQRKRPGSLGGPVLEGITLQEASLSHLDDELRCERSMVRDAILPHTRASGVVFDTCEFWRAAFEGSVLRRLRLLDSRLEKCNASNAEWDSAHLRRIEFLGCRLTGIALTNANGSMSSSRIARRSFCVAKVPSGPMCDSKIACCLTPTFVAQH